jgi:hypothetical protein
MLHTQQQGWLDAEGIARHCSSREREAAKPFEKGSPVHGSASP